jgi:hypothetical protein
MERTTYHSPREYWAEKSACGEMWLGYFVDPEHPDQIYQTQAYGDFDTAQFYARFEQEKRKCPGYRPRP